MIAAQNALQRSSHPLIEELHVWALRTPSRQLYDLIAFGLVAIPVGFSGVSNWYVLAGIPLSFAALGAWALLHHSALSRPTRSRRLAALTLSAITFLLTVSSLLGVFFWLLGPAPHF